MYFWGGCTTLDNVAYSDLPKEGGGVGGIDPISLLKCFLGFSVSHTTENNEIIKALTRF